MTARWYAFRTEPQKERATQQILTRYGIHAVVPTEIKWVRQCRHQKRRPREYPMLIGYVLCRFDSEPPWFFLFDRLRCVKSVVGFGGQPTPISATSIGALLQRQGEIVPHARSLNTRRSFGPGDDVRIALGGFRGYEGKVEAVRGAKARMILEFLGSRREIDIPLEALEAA